MKSRTPYRLHDALGYQLSITARIQERRFEERLKQHGLTRITWCILLAVHVEELTQPSDIARFIGIDRTATSRALRHMESSGTIARRTGKDDKRTTHVATTDKGAALVAAVSPLARENAAYFRNKLSDAENAELIRLLAKLREGESTALKQL